MTAIALFSQIAALDFASRFQQWASGEAQAILQMLQFAPLNGPAFINDPGDPYSGLITLRVMPGSEAASLGVRRGDRLTSVCSTFVSSVNGMLAAASRAIGSQECVIAFTRGNERITYIGSGARRHGWRIAHGQAQTWPAPQVSAPMPPNPTPYVPPSRPAPPAYAPPSAQSDTPGPTFDCTVRLTKVEHMICSNPELAAKDRELASLYESLIGGLHGQARSELVASEHAWLRQRGQCREPGMKLCIVACYEQRIGELKRQLSLSSGLSRKEERERPALSSRSAQPGAAVEPRDSLARRLAIANTPTRCLNAISLAKTRFGADWRSAIAPADVVTCAAELQRAGD